MVVQSGICFALEESRAIRSDGRGRLITQGKFTLSSAASVLLQICHGISLTLLWLLLFCFRDLENQTLGQGMMNNAL